MQEWLSPSITDQHLSHAAETRCKDPSAFYAAPCSLSHVKLYEWLLCCCFGTPPSLCSRRESWGPRSLPRADQLKAYWPAAEDAAGDSGWVRESLCLTRHLSALNARQERRTHSALTSPAALKCAPDWQSAAVVRWWAEHWNACKQT